MLPQDYYSTQSELSDPGKFVSLYKDLPDNLTNLCKVIQTTYLHFMGGKRFDYQIPKHSIADADSRHVELILKRMITLDNRPLTEPRPVEKRFVGCCRDASLLLCSMLRHKGIPARIRAGFAAYINGNDYYNYDHVVTEYWDKDESRWKLVDAEQDKDLIERNDIQFDVQDIPRDQFIVAGKAWDICSKHKTEINFFGFSPKGMMKGTWILRNRLTHDLAMLNKHELLLWDTWSCMRYKATAPSSKKHLYDLAAEFTQSGDNCFEAMQALFSDPLFHPPDEVMCYSPAAPAKMVNWKR